MVRAGRGTLREVRDGSGDPWRGPGRVGGSSGRFGMGRGTLGSYSTGWLILGEIREGLRNPSLGRVEGLSEMSKRVGGPTEWSETGRGSSGRFGVDQRTHPEFWDGSVEPWNGLGDLRGGLGWVGRPSEWSGTGWGLSGWFGTGQLTLGVIRDGSGSYGWLGGPSGRSGTGQRTVGEVQDWSWDPRGSPERVSGLSGRYGTVRGPSGRSGTVRWTLGEVRDR